ncbi:MAG: WD40 repeat domain-containing protein [Anaerolineae bacterium]|nr:WD40 repeat domain-containing protein [Anaerolineae bacterium]
MKSRYALRLLLLLGILFLPQINFAAATPTRYPVIANKNAHRLKQISRIGEGVAGGGLAYSPDGKTLAVSSSLGVWLFNGSGPFDKPIRFLDQDDWVHNVAFSPDGKILAAAGNKSIWLWDVRRGTKRGTFPGDTLVDFSPDGRLLATRGLSGDGFGGWPTATVRIFDAATGVELSTLIANQWSTRTTDLAFSPDGKLIAAIWSATSYGGGCGDDSQKRIQIWRMKDVFGKWRVTPDDMLFSAETTGLHFSFSPDSTKLVYGNATEGGGIAIWDTRTHSVEAVWDEGWFDNAAFNSNGTFLAAVKQDISEEAYQYKTILYDAHLGKPIQTLNQGLDAPTFSPDDHTLAGFYGNELQLIHLPNGDIEDINVSKPLYFSADGTTAVAYMPDRTFRIVDVATGAIRIFAPEQFSETRQFLLSDDGTLLVTVNTDNKVRLWNVVTKTLQSSLAETLPIKNGNAVMLAIKPDGSVLATATWQDNDRGKIAFWNIATGALIGTIDDATFLFDPTVAFSPHNNLFAAMRKQANVYGWVLELWQVDATRIQKLVTLNGDRPVVFNRQDTALVYQDQQEVYFYDVPSGASTLLYTLSGVVASASRVHGAFSADGSRLALSELSYAGCGPGYYRSFYMLDAKSLVLSVPWLNAGFVGHDNLTFNPAGDVFVSTNENTIQIWNSATAAQLATLQNHAGLVRRIAFTADGTRMLSQSDDGTIRVWAVQ